MTRQKPSSPDGPAASVHTSLARLAKETFKRWWEHDVGRSAAAVAFYSLFALAPVLLVAVAVAGKLFGEQAARGELVGYMNRWVGAAGAEVLEDVLAAAARQRGGWLISAGGLLVSLVGATAVFVELQQGLNALWGVCPRASGFVRILRERFGSFLMVLACGLLLAVSLAASAAIAVLSRQFGVLPRTGLSLEAVNFLLSFAVVTVLFAMLYRFLPDALIAWRDVWAGALAGSFLLMIGTWAVGLYLGSSTLRSAYGAAGSLVALLVWVYYSAQIFYLGATFTYMYATKLGAGIHLKRSPSGEGIRSSV